MSLWSDILTGSVGSIIKDVGGVVSDLVTTDKERLAAEIEMEELGVRREEAYLGDRQNARNMQVAALQQDDIFSKRFVYLFAAAWSIFAMAFMLVVTLCDIPEQNYRMVDTILGFLLGTAIAGIFNFFLGTTYRSQKKDDTISTLARNKNG